MVKQDLSELLKPILWVYLICPRVKIILENYQIQIKQLLEENMMIFCKLLEA